MNAYELKQQLDDVYGHIDYLTRQLDNMYSKTPDIHLQLAVHLTNATDLNTRLRTADRGHNDFQFLIDGVVEDRSVKLQKIQTANNLLAEALTVVTSIYPQNRDDLL